MSFTEYVNKEFPESTPVLVYTNLQTLIEIELLQSKEKASYCYSVTP